jgi:TonB family protein
VCNHLPVTQSAGRNMENQPQKKTAKFLKLPSYPGGRDAYRKFVSMHLAYPAQALENGIQGTVYLSFVVDHMGRVIEVKVLKGIGYGCDEEACRVIRLLQYNKVRNRGIRLRAEIKTGIRFILPLVTTGVQYTYSVTPASAEKAFETEKGSSYSYTITFQS